LVQVYVKEVFANNGKFSVTMDPSVNKKAVSQEEFTTM